MTADVAMSMCHDTRACHEHPAYVRLLHLRPVLRNFKFARNLDAAGRILATPPVDSYRIKSWNVRIEGFTSTLVTVDIGRDEKLHYDSRVSEGTLRLCGKSLIDSSFFEPYVRDATRHSLGISKKLDESGDQHRNSHCTERSCLHPPQNTGSPPPCPSPSLPPRPSWPICAPNPTPHYYQKEYTTYDGVARSRSLGVRAMRRSSLAWHLVTA